MNLRHVASCGLACAVLVLAGCDEGRQPPGKVGVRVVNVAPGFEELVFRREREPNGATTLSVQGRAQSSSTTRTSTTSTSSSERSERTSRRSLDVRAEARLGSQLHVRADGGRRRGAAAGHRALHGARGRGAIRRSARGERPAGDGPLSRTARRRNRRRHAARHLQRARANGPACVAERRLRALVDRRGRPGERLARDDDNHLARRA